MSERYSTSRWLALQLAEQAARMVPFQQRHWTAAMRNELDYVADDRQALAWAAGCLRATLMERLRAVYVPDTRVIRLLMILPLAILVFSDVFATALTAAYRMGALGVASVLGGLTPGDDYRRLIPLMENVPLWLHGLWISAAALYAFTILRLIGKKRVSCVPVLFAIALEVGAHFLKRPVIAAIGVAANPNPSAIATIFPVVLPVCLALYLWKMKEASYV